MRVEYRPLATLATRIASAGALAWVALWPATAAAGDKIDDSPLLCFGVRAGVVLASQQQSYTFSILGDGPIDYGLTGPAPELEAVAMLGARRLRVIAKFQNLSMPLGLNGTSGQLSLLTAGLRFQTAPDNHLAAVVEITGGASRASGNMYDSGACDWTSCRTPSHAQISTTAGILEAAGGARFPSGFEVLGEIWFGPLTAAGLGASAGWSFGI
jgi:hypothetical protein